MHCTACPFAQRACVALGCTGRGRCVCRPIYQYIDTSCMKALNRETAPFFNQVQAELTATSKTNVAVQFVLFKIFGLVRS
jgi:hypothetical protein